MLAGSPPPAGADQDEGATRRLPRRPATKVVIFQAVRHPGSEPLAAPAAAVAARYVRRGPGLVDEHQAFRIQVRLALEPGLPLAQDVKTLLLRGMPRFF